MAEKKAADAAPKKAPAAKKAAPKAGVAAKAEAPKAVKPKTGSAPKGALRVVQVGSPIGRQKEQRATLIGLGLNKINRERELPDTPETRGMLNKVKHSVRVSQ